MRVMAWKQMAAESASVMQSKASRMGRPEVSSRIWSSKGRVGLLYDATQRAPNERGNWAEAVDATATVS
jgi:hypothetical protein